MIVLKYIQMKNSDYPFDHVGIFTLFFNISLWCLREIISYMYQQMTQNRYVYRNNVINTFSINL